MSSEFDATLVCCDEPVAPEAVAAHLRTVEHLAHMPTALTNAKLHAERELQRLIIISNRMVWGNVPAELRQPSPEESAGLLTHLSPEDREKLVGNARAANAQRFLLDRMEGAQALLQAQLQAERYEIAAREAFAREWAEFEVYDAAGKERRFVEWRTAMGR